jgi:hypothetical protein
MHTTDISVIKAIMDITVTKSIENPRSPHMYIADITATIDKTFMRASGTKKSTKPHGNYGHLRHQG